MNGERGREGGSKGGREVRVSQRVSGERDGRHVDGTDTNASSED